MMRGGGAEIPQMRVLIAHQHGVTRHLVARPFPDHGRGEIADIVVVEAQDRAEIGIRQRFLRPRQAVFVQPREIHPLFEIDRRMTRCRNRAVPFIMGVQIGIAGKGARIGHILRHGGLP